VPFHIVVFGGSVAVAFLRLHVDEDRPVAEVASLLEDPLHREEIVTVDRAEVREPELLEEDVGDEERLQACEDSPASLLGQLPTGHVLEDLTADLFCAAIGLGRPERFEHARDGADVRRDAHAVVVQHHDHPRAHVADVVHRFVRHPRRESAISDDRDDVVVITLDVARDGHSLGRGDGRSRVPRAKVVVLRLNSGEKA